MAKIVITGASGFIGHGVATALIVNHNCVGLTRSPVTKKSVLPMLQVDYNNVESLSDAFRDCDLVLHLADNASRNSTAEDTSRGSAEVLRQALERAGVPHLIYASSIYARLSQETGRSRYGAHKLASEGMFNDSESFNTISLRLPPVYGPGCGGGFALLAKLVRNGLPLPLGLATAKRDYIARDNLVSLIKKLVEIDKTAWQRLDCQSIEPSDGSPVSTADLARMMGQVMNCKVAMVPIPSGILRLVGRSVGKSELVSGIIDPLAARSNEEICQITGWQPIVSMPESMSFLMPD